MISPRDPSDRPPLPPQAFHPTVKTSNRLKVAAVILATLGVLLWALAVAGRLLHSYYVLRPWLDHPVMFGVAGCLALAAAWGLGIRHLVLKSVGMILFGMAGAGVVGGQRTQPVQQPQQRPSLEALGHCPEKQHRDGREHQFVDNALDQRDPIGGMRKPFDDSRAQAEDQREKRGRHDGDARGTGGERRAPQTDVGLPGLGLHPDDQLAEITHRLGQSPLAEAGMNAAFELRHGGSNVVSGKLDLVSSRAGLRHATTVGVLIIPQRETRRPPGRPLEPTAHCRRPHGADRCNVTPMPEPTLLSMLRERAGLAARWHFTGFDA